MRDDLFQIGMIFWLVPRPKEAKYVALLVFWRALECVASGIERGSTGSMQKHA